MRLVVFGLSVSSSWGNGHASLWRGLIAALTASGHRVTFFERDVPYYAANRDLTTLPDGGALVLYPSWAEVLPRARRAITEADVTVVTSFCPDAIDAGDLVRNASRLGCFYDLDTPVTLERIEANAPVPYLGADGLAGFDLVLSYTGGGALDALRARLGAQRVAALYGWADPAVYRREQAMPQYRAALSYLGTYAADRQDALQRLLLAAARRRPDDRFVIGGVQYPFDFPWSDNIFFVRHLPPSEHPAFFSSSKLTLNVTRAAMARMGHCPSGRLFEAACCGTPILTDGWAGIDDFFEPGREILVGNDTDDTIEALERSPCDLLTLATRARARVLAEHTASHRARRMIELFETLPEAAEA